MGAYKYSHIRSIHHQFAKHKISCYFLIIAESLSSHRSQSLAEDDQSSNEFTTALKRGPYFAVLVISASILFGLVLFGLIFVINKYAVKRRTIISVEELGPPMQYLNLRNLKR